MGREIRRVPADWEHPRRKCGYHNCRLDDSEFPTRHGWDRSTPDARCNGMHFMALHDNDYESASEEWKQFVIAWFSDSPYVVDYRVPREEQSWPSWAGSRDGYIDRKGKYTKGYCQWPWEDDSPPDEEVYRARRWSVGEATHYQMYETVSEGSPVSPVFASLEELADWLVQAQGYSPEAAEGFCKSGWGPSLTMTGGGTPNVKIYDAVESSVLE